jgi:hypothetical protein
MDQFVSKRWNDHLRREARKAKPPPKDATDTTPGSEKHGSDSHAQLLVDKATPTATEKEKADLVKTQWEAVQSPG